MASAAASSFAILSPNSRVFAAKTHAPMAVSSLPKPFISQTLNLSSNFNGLRKSFQPLRSFSSRYDEQSSERSFGEEYEYPLVGNIAPDFKAEAVLKGDITTASLSEFKEKNYVILFFYQLDFTVLCPTEIIAFNDRYEEFKRLDTEILGVSTDGVYSHLAWVKKISTNNDGGLGELKYRLVSDVTKSISKKYNVLIPDKGYALRGLFIIDKQGLIQHSTINSLAIGRSVDETLRILQALQYVQENPDEVCPAGWKPGEIGLKADLMPSEE